MLSFFNRATLLGLSIAVIAGVCLYLEWATDIAAAAGVMGYIFLLIGINQFVNAQLRPRNTIDQGQLRPGSCEVLLYGMVVPSGVFIVYVYLYEDIGSENGILFFVIFSLLLISATFWCLISVTLPKVRWSEAGVQKMTLFSERFIPSGDIVSLRRDSEGDGYGLASRSGERISFTCMRDGGRLLTQFIERQIITNRVRHYEAAYQHPASRDWATDVPLGQLKMGAVEYVAYTFAICGPIIFYAVIGIYLDQVDLALFYLFFVFYIFYQARHFYKYSLPKVTWSADGIRFSAPWGEARIAVGDVESIEYADQSKLASGIRSKDGTRITFLSSRSGVDDLTRFAEECLWRNRTSAMG